MNFTNISNAIKAIEGVKNKSDYANLRIAHGKDRCANPPRSGPQGGSGSGMRRSASGNGQVSAGAGNGSAMGMGDEMGDGESFEGEVGMGMGVGDEVVDEQEMDEVKAEAE